MKRTAFHARRPRLAVAFTILAALLFVRLGVPARALNQLSVEQERAANLSRQLDVARRDLGDEPRIRAAALTRDSLLAVVETRLFAGLTRSAQIGAAADHFRAMARSASVELNSVQIQRDSVAGSDFQRIVIVADASADIRGLTRLLAAIEGGPKLMRVRSLSVSQQDLVGGPTAPERLSIRLAVNGFAKEARP